MPRGRVVDCNPARALLTGLADIADRAAFSTFTTLSTWSKHQRAQRSCSINVVVRISALTTSVNDASDGQGRGKREDVRRMKMRKPPVAIAILVGSLALLGFGCGPIVERAPFSSRPDTMSSGDLLGPFEGIVVDAETDRPLAGAVVSAS